MIRTLLMVGLAGTTLIGFIFAAPSSAVKASTPEGKTSSLETRLIGSACSRHAWPYYETNCLRDHRKPAGQVTQVRLVSSNRLPIPDR